MASTLWGLLMFCDSAQVIVHRSNTRVGFLTRRNLSNGFACDSRFFQQWHIYQINLINAIDVVDLDNTEVGEGEGGVQPAVGVHHTVRHSLNQADVMVNTIGNFNILIIFRQRPRELRLTETQRKRLTKTQRKRKRDKAIFNIYIVNLPAFGKKKFMNKLSQEDWLSCCFFSLKRI